MKLQMAPSLILLFRLKIQFQRPKYPLRQYNRPVQVSILTFLCCREAKRKVKQRLSDEGPLDYPLVAITMLTVSSLHIFVSFSIVHLP
jgi:hypothetical protein